MHSTCRDKEISLGFPGKEGLLLACEGKLISSFFSDGESAKYLTFKDKVVSVVQLLGKMKCNLL